ncbi:MAG: M14-type cytosolic carboxypeptidase, partial [Bacteroidota bacterium]
MRYLFYLGFLLLTACHQGARHYDFPTPVDTSTREIKLQEKRSWTFPFTGLTFDNQFDGARVNQVNQEASNLYQIWIEPENTPINPSPWYAFRIQAERDKRFTVHLTYDDNANHRYFPKVSADRKNWVPVDTTKVLRNVNGKELYVMLEMK